MAVTGELDTGRLRPYLEAHVDGFTGPLEIEKFAGGQSNPTYRLDTPSGAYVLRRKPPGRLLRGAHAVEREGVRARPQKHADPPQHHGERHGRFAEIRKENR